MAKEGGDDKSDNDRSRSQSGTTRVRNLKIRRVSITTVPEAQSQPKELKSQLFWEGDAMRS
eukprot:4218749-Amphidinium_carterae.2